jgi:hypothetical protein
LHALYLGAQAMKFTFENGYSQQKDISEDRGGIALARFGCM